MIDYKKMLFYCAVLMGVSLALLRILQDSIGTNATNVSFAERYAASLFVPEGWGFFTRSPREEKMILYSATKDGKIGEQVTFRNSSAQNLLGFSRRSRRLSLEFGRLLPEITQSSWSSTITDCNKKENTTKVAYSKAHYILLPPGNYFVKKYNLTPWAWLNFVGHFSTKSQYAKVILQ